MTERVIVVLLAFAVGAAVFITIDALLALFFDEQMRRKSPTCFSLHAKANSPARGGARVPGSKSALYGTGAENGAASDVLRRRPNPRPIRREPWGEQ